MTQIPPYSGVDNLEVMHFARRYNFFLVSLVNKYAPTRGRLLDFGAGTGTYTRRIAKEGRDIVCVEPDSTLNKALTREGFEVHESLGSIADSSCDFIYSLNVLEHIPDDLGTAKQLFRVLNPGGLCFVYVPAMQILFSAMDAKVGHIRRYGRDDLKSLLEDAGFITHRIHYADSIGFFATMAYKLWGNSEGTLNKRALILYDRFVFPLSRLLDTVAHFWVGKNLVAVVQKPLATETSSKSVCDGTRVPLENGR